MYDDDCDKIPDFLLFFKYETKITNMSEKINWWDREMKKRNTRKKKE